MNRKTFLKGLAASAGLMSCKSDSLSAAQSTDGAFKISLAQWSLHRAFQSGKIDPLDFPSVALREFDIRAVEYVNAFYLEQKKQKMYWKQLRQKCNDEGVQSVLIMCDREGLMGDPSKKRRTQTVENHLAWLENAKTLGCHGIRVNAKSFKKLPADEQAKYCIEGLRDLSEKAADMQMNILVENHGGLSGKGKWLTRVIQKVGMDNCGTLPDFGNFGKYDRYQGLRDLMPYAKGVSAKSFAFDNQGNETSTDYRKALKIVHESGFDSWVGIEYEGKEEEFEGVRKTKKLLEAYLHV